MLEMAVTDMVLTLQGHGPRDAPSRRFIGCRAWRIVIVKTRNRSTPVVHKKAQTIRIDEGGHSNIHLLRNPLAIFKKINASKIRRRQQPVHIFPLLHEPFMAAFPFRQHCGLLINRKECFFEIFVRAGVDRNLFPESFADIRCLIP
ncbi:hypothetical protein D3C75_1028710 [compost metagenome]